MNKLELLKLSELQDCEAFTESDFEEENKNSNNQKFKKEYEDYYDDVKQQNKYIKEDW